MRQMLAVAVLGASLAFSASAALADDRGYESVDQPKQVEVMGPQTEAPLSVIAGPTGSASDVDVTRESSNR